MTPEIWILIPEGRSHHTYRLHLAAFPSRVFYVIETTGLRYHRVNSYLTKECDAGPYRDGSNRMAGIKVLGRSLVKIRLRVISASGKMNTEV